MIRHHALQRMLILECAASDWFARLDPIAQEAYRRAHPGSKYGGGGHAALPSNDHVGHIRHHDHMVRFHSQRAHQGGEDLDDPRYGSHAHAVTLHAMAGSRHLRALNNPHDTSETKKAMSMSHEADERTRRVLHPRPGKD